jgi:hypothetical protein
MLSPKHLSAVTMATWRIRYEDGLHLPRSHYHEAPTCRDKTLAKRVVERELAAASLTSEGAQQEHITILSLDFADA